MRTGILIRTGSFTARPSTALSSPRTPSRSSSLSPRPVHRANVSERTEISVYPKTLRRARSDGVLVGSDRLARVAIPARVVEEEEEVEVEYSGGGMGKGRKVGGGRRGEGQGGDRNEDGRIAEYYEEMLRNDPTNPLLLRNYGKFLHEMEGDVEKAEEYYGRAILASPGDGEVLSLYGTLVWETHGDEERAGAYLERAVKASPDDCFVLGSYAHFLWDTEEDEEKQEADKVSSSPLVEAF